MKYREDLLVKVGKNLMEKLFPLCRSITGDGVRKTLSIINELTSINIKEIPSGTKCYDWIIPNEWIINDAFIKNSAGKKLVDFKKNNLQVLNYSTPIYRKMPFLKLKDHIYTLPRQPKAIPYRTSYYHKNWGFCVAFNDYKRFDKNGIYEVYIDSKFKKGSLTYADQIIKGKSKKELIFSTYCCHPSLANDNVSGIILWSLLLMILQQQNRKYYYSYRFIIVPETIGAIAYLQNNETKMKQAIGGFEITTVAGPGKIGYKQTFLDNSLIDMIVKKVFLDKKISYLIYPFDTNGSDERQYSSPFFRIPIGTICKSKYYEYNNYHTSLDNLSFININNLIKTLKIYIEVIEYIEMNKIYNSLYPKCEPMYSKRNLYSKIGGSFIPRATDLNTNVNKSNNIINNLMFYSDGNMSLLDISDKINIPIPTLYQNAEYLVNVGLLRSLNKRKILK